EPAINIVRRRSDDESIEQYEEFVRTLEIEHHATGSWFRDPEPRLIQLATRGRFTRDVLRAFGVADESLDTTVSGRCTPFGRDVHVDPSVMGVGQNWVDPGTGLPLTTGVRDRHLVQIADRLPPARSIHAVTLGQQHVPTNRKTGPFALTQIDRPEVGSLA